MALCMRANAGPRLVVEVGPRPWHRNDYNAWAESAAPAAVGRTTTITTIADGGYPRHRPRHPAPQGTREGSP